MIVCGIEVTASEARLVVLKGTKASYSHLGASPAQLPLENDEKPAEVKAFMDAIHAFLRDNKVERVAIKKRAKRGQYAGSPVSFKMEGLIQLYSECDIVLVSPQTISAAKRKQSPVAPDDISDDQQVAFETAFTKLD